MSFADEVGLDNQLPYSDSPEFDRLAEKISSGLFEVNSNLVKLSSILKAFKKKKDDVQMEERAVEIADSTRESFKLLGHDMKQLQTWPESLPTQRFTQQKLSTEFSGALSEFQELQRALAERQRSSIVQAKTNMASSNVPNLIDEEEAEQEVEQQQQQQQQQQQEEQLNQQELDYQNTLIAERESEIADIEQGIEELNEIFTDLGTIVTEQGTIIDNIEANIYNVAESTQDASTQLTRAARSQRNSRGRAFCLLMILVVILTIILLATFLG